MNWLKEIETTEIALVALFLFLYILYFFRIIRVARRLGIPYSNVFIKLILRSLYFTLFIVALLGPSFGESSKEVKAVGKDIYICVDLSQSMDAYDIQPSRLEKVKFELKKVIASFTSDRIGLIIFSSEAFVQCPLTYDQSHLSLMIETLHTGLVPRSGTDFGPPLRMALDKIEDEENETSKKSSKIIMLISDGEDFGETTSSMANRIEEAGIKLFTLGIGTTQGSKIRIRQEFKRDAEGNEIISKLNPKDLQTLAVSTGGKYFEINETKNDINRLINTINSIEGELRDTKKVDVTINKYYYFLGLGLLLLLIDLLINVKVIKI